MVMLSILRISDYVKLLLSLLMEKVFGLCVDTLPICRVKLFSLHSYARVLLPIIRVIFDFWS